MRPGKLDLPIIWRGSTYPGITFTWLDRGGNPIDLTGWTPNATSRNINLQSVIVGNPVNGITRISLSKSQTADLKLGVEQWDWVWTNNGTTCPPLLAGTVEVKEPITFEPIGPPPLPPPPPAPVATPATAIFYNRFTAHWNSVVGVTRYRIDVATDNLFTHFVFGFQNLPVGNALSKVVDGLNPTTTYFYRVRAVNDVGGFSPDSNIISVATTAIPPPVNDTFTGNIAISGDQGLVTGTTIGATRENGEPTGDNSVWYRWRTFNSIIAYFSLDTNANQISVYTGNAVGNLTLVATSVANPPTLSFIPESGVLYRVRVYKLNHTDQFTLTWTFSL